ncbi:MAG TPA: hypothetical protein PLQ87_12980 [Phycisphaerae bacterium]|nr:hypothetical protein [Phycisphaerae bacterium]
MIFTVDGQRVNESFTPEDTLQTSIDRVRANYPSERLIVSVSINGQRLNDADLAARLAQPLGAGAQVDLETGCARTLVTDALRGLALEFDQAGGQLADIANRLSAGQGAAAVRDVGAFVSLWQTCYRALAQCSGLLGDDLTTYLYEGRTVKEWLADLILKLDELRGALEAHDTVLLADLLRYEMQPLTQTWQSVTASLAEQVAGGSDGTT